VIADRDSAFFPLEAFFDALNVRASIVRSGSSSRWTNATRTQERSATVLAQVSGMLAKALICMPSI
jgi:hypothetical protein